MHDSEQEDLPSMFVKKLELMGFKTFADKSVVELNGGITAIVGPNGSGKSNIADAFLWVLGESNVRNLRGQRVTDVIFNGSEKRRSLGMAEVSLTLDNSDGRLPLDFNEVTVTRRAFRSGEGEYFINNTRCRLKDIYELFLDTGVGREAYSIITQGEIDAVLSAKPEDRRGLFEEAAGIRKYRYRREEAMKKLERTEQNLRRVCDIMSEIGSQVEPLAAQAEQAKRYTELQSRLWDIEIGLLIRDLRRFSTSLEEVRSAKEDSSPRIAEYDKRISELEEQKATQGAQLKALEEEVESARRIQQTLSGNWQRLEARSAVLQERMRSAQSSRTQTQMDCETLETRIREAGEKIAALEAELASCVENDKLIRAQAAALEAAVAEAEKNVAAVTRSVSDRKAGYLELAKELSAKRESLAHAQQRASELASAIGKRKEEVRQLEANTQATEDRARAAAAELESIETQAVEAEESVTRLAAERKSVEELIRDRAAEHNRLLTEIASKSSRLKTLKEMDEAREGFSEGVRGVLSAAKQGRLSGDFAAVADVIHVTQGYELAVETALGPAAQDLVTSSGSEVASALAYLKDGRAGRATLLALDRVRQVEPCSISKAEGIVSAVELIQCETKFEPVVTALLGNVLVADTLDIAIASSEKLSGWHKIVTLEGEVVLSSGAVTGGKSKGKSQGLVQRKAEMDLLAKEVDGLEAQASGLSDELSKHREEASRIAAELRTAERVLSEGRVALADRRKALEMSREVISSLTERVEKANAEVASASSALSQAESEAVRLADELQAADDENAQLDQTVADEEAKANELRQVLDERRGRLAQMNVESAGLSARVSGIRSSIQESGKAVDEFTSALRSRKAQIEALDADAKTLESEMLNVSTECENQKKLLDTADTRLQEVSRSRTETASMAARTDADLREVTGSRNRYAESAHEADVREARLEVQIAQITERLLTEYELTYERAMEWPEEEIEVERGAVTEVSRLRRELRDMGAVNTGAVQEYERVKERWDFLTAQRTDLDNAKAQINEAIRDIDSKTRELFVQTFDAAAAHFESMFKQLFGGGRADLTLTDPKDPLETGINISVQPPGKKMQDLALLSGGERALTATALIFALLKIKPSPFVLLDEVDAPLDESNVERFADVVKEFAGESQFVVITHNRATMEASESLYGVTMQEPGISKLVSVKLSAEGPIERELDPVVTA